MKLFALISACLCIYKEEAGVYDWYQPHVGVVKDIARSNNEILMSTRSGIVALMDEHSKIKWRRQLGGSVQGIIRDGNSNNLVLNLQDGNDYSSYYSHVLYSLDRKGFQNWRLKLENDKVNQLVKMVMDEDSVYLLFTDRLVKIFNGTVVYTDRVESIVDFAIVDNAVLLVPYSSNGQLQIHPMDGNGAMLSSVDYGVEIISDSTKIVLSETGSTPYLVFETSKGIQMTKMGLKKSAVIPLSDSIPKEATLVFLKPHNLRLATGIIIIQKTNIQLLTILDDGTSKILSKFEKSDLKSPIFQFNVLDKSIFAFTMIGRDKELVYHESIIVSDGVASNTFNSVKFDFTLTGDIQWASVDFTNSIPSVVIGTLDGSFHLVDDTKRWTMEESLTDTAVSVLMDIPSYPEKPVDLLKLLNESFQERVVRHFSEVLGYFERIFKGGEKVENDLLVSHDHHGFKKLAIFGSRTGKLIAIETEKGKIVWERFFPKLQPTYLFVTRDHKSGLKPIITLISVVKDSQQTVSILIDALTGNDFKDANSTTSMKTIGVVTYAVLTNYVDEYLKIKTVAFVALESALLFPPNVEIQSQFDQKSFYYYLTPGIGSNFIHGYRATGKLTLPTWAIDFPDGEEIVAMDMPDKSPVANVGRVLGDRRVLYKYLNPNLASVLTVKEDEDGKESTLYSYLIDLVSGKIHEKHVHYGAGRTPGKISEGVKTMICENFVVYTFWNYGVEKLPKLNKDTPSSPHDHYEMVVLELYQSATPDVRHDRSNYSSFDSDRLESIGFSFVIENDISALGVTTTHAGITSREILVAYEHGMLQGLSRRFLDPRRPVGALTTEQKTEGLIPYFPAMSIHGPLTVTYHLQVLGIDRIQSIATNLESSSIIVVSGVDLFSTKRTPSKPFDTLSSDFSYSQLIASMIVLSLAVFVTYRAVGSKYVREAWN